MNLRRRSLRHHLERMGQAPVPPPSSGFAVRTEERLRAHSPVAAVTDLTEPAEPADLTGGADELAVARARRRPPVLAAAAAAAAVLAFLLAGPDGEESVTLTDDNRASSTSAPVEVTTTTLGQPTTTTTSTGPVVAPPDSRPAATTTTTAPARPVRPTTTTAAVPVRPTTSLPVIPDPPVTAPTTTTTKPAVIARLQLTCTAGRTDAVDHITCTWSAFSDPTFAGWRLYRAAGADPKRTVFTSAEVGIHSYADRAVVAGTTYQYLVEAYSTSGQPLAKSAIVTVPCCTP